MSEVSAHRVRMASLVSAIDTAIASGCEDAETEPNHYFAEGTYVRELMIKKGTFMAGKSHRFCCVSIFIGHCKVITESDDFEINGIKTMTTGTGTKGIFAIEDTLLITVHPNPDNGTDLEKIESRLIEENL